MTPSEAVDLTGMIERVTSDPVAFVERILQQVLDQLADEYALGRDAAGPPEEMISKAVASRLAQMFVDGDTSESASSSAVNRGGDGSTEYEELVYRNSALAAAVGACDCWGEHVHCPICNGAGAPGWAFPDKRLFEMYVGPALHAASSNDAPPGSARRNRSRKERRDESYAGSAVGPIPERDPSPAGTAQN